MDRFVRERTNNLFGLPITDELYFKSLFYDFVTTDFKGMQSLLMFDLGISTPKTPEEEPRLIYMKITAQSVGRA